MKHPMKFNVDVLVCGGGVAGCGAAIAAARHGARTLLIEGRESLGGLCTNGYINGIAGLVTGICREWVDRLAAKGQAFDRPHLPSVDPEYGKFELEQMVLQAGSMILYGVHVVDTEVIDGTITKVIAYGKGGLMEIGASMVIDCTGDADVAYASGVPCEIGSPDFLGLNQSVGMGFRMSYVDIEKYRKAEEEWQKQLGSEDWEQIIVAKEKEAVENGDLPYPLVPGLLVYPVLSKNLNCTDVCFDATQSYFCHNDDVMDLTRQIVDQHRQIELFVSFLQKYVPGFENAVLTSTANMNGVRDSRRAVGEYIITAEDMAYGRKFEDGVVQYPEGFDPHHPTSTKHVAFRHCHVKAPGGTAVCRPSQDDNDYHMHPFVPLGGYEARCRPGEWCDIPYRSLVASKVNNLFVAGRCFSADWYAMGGMRIIATCMSMGQACGTAAAMCVREKIYARDMDGVRVRQQLIEDGVPLDKAPDGFWAYLREKNADADFVVTAGDMLHVVNPDGTKSGVVVTDILQEDGK